MKRQAFGTLYHHMCVCVCFLHEVMNELADFKETQVNIMSQCPTISNNKMAGVLSDKLSAVLGLRRDFGTASAWWTVFERYEKFVKMIFVRFMASANFIFESLKESRLREYFQEPLLFLFIVFTHQALQYHWQYAAGCNIHSSVVCLTALSVALDDGMTVSDELETLWKGLFVEH